MLNKISQTEKDKRVHRSREQMGDCQRWDGGGQNG